jgi:hypothetical protein
LALELKMAKALGMAIPPTLLALADAVFAERRACHLSLALQPVTALVHGCYVDPAAGFACASVRHAAARLHYSSRRRGSDFVARRARAAIGITGESSG